MLAMERSAAETSSEGEVVGRWLLDEMFAPGGTAKGAEDARKRLLDRKTTHDGVFAALGSALWDETHGDPKRAAAGYVTVLSRGTTSSDPATPLATWLATHHLVALRGSMGSRTSPRH